MAEKKRQDVLHGFVPGEVSAHYDVTRDGNTITLTPLDGGEPRSIPMAHHDPLFWYQAGLDARAGKDKPAKK